jgi:dTDP-glucose 4,6-dehydratase
MGNAETVCVVTGGAGFLGSHLCERLLAEGHRVVCIDNLVTGDKENISHLADNDKFRFIHHDVSEYITVDGPVHHVLHFASPASPIDYLKLPIQTLKVGSLGTHKARRPPKRRERGSYRLDVEVYGDPLIHPRKNHTGGTSIRSVPRVYDGRNDFPRR